MVMSMTTRRLTHYYIVRDSRRWRALTLMMLMSWPCWRHHRRHSNTPQSLDILNLHIVAYLTNNLGIHIWDLFLLLWNLPKVVVLIIQNRLGQRTLVENQVYRSCRVCVVIISRGGDGYVIAISLIRYPDMRWVIPLEQKVTIWLR